MSSPLADFRNHVIAEAQKQREFRAAGQSIPSEFRRYARLVGVVVALVGMVAEVIVLSMGLTSGEYFVFMVLFCAALVLLGLLQATTGIHLLTRR
jgi:hypothetical protein